MPRPFLLMHTHLFAPVAADSRPEQKKRNTKGADHKPHVVVDVVHDNSADEAYAAAAANPADILPEHMVDLCTADCWINDSIIDAYVRLLGYGCQGAVFLEYSTFCAVLCGYSVREAATRGHKNVDRYAGCDRVLLPANVNKNHWVLFEAHLNSMQLHVYDSAGKLWAKDKQCRSHLQAYFAGLAGSQAREWQVKAQKCPQQVEDDCGAFMLSNLRYRLASEQVDGVSAPQQGRGLAGTVLELRRRIAREIEAGALEEWL